jgi:plasmid stability protein
MDLMWFPHLKRGYQMISLISIFQRNRVCGQMADLIVRKLDPRIVDALKRRAASNGRSAEAEHRALLESILLAPARKSFAEALCAIPNVGLDEDFKRIGDGDRNRNVFD